MGVFGTKATVNQVQKEERKGGYSKGSWKGSKPKAMPVKTLRVKMLDADKSEYLTGLFTAAKQPDNATLLQGEDKEGNRYSVYINEDGSGSLIYTPAGAEKGERLTGLFLNEGQYGPYHSGKTKEGHRFYIADAKPRE
jgi:hypothetical protein